MDEKKLTPAEIEEQLENVEVGELDDEDLEDASGGSGTTINNCSC